ncbi:MAG: NAD-dependent protein deacylase, partial [Clostridia bacterium]|nr:NAD-dependent protein deacylase [Clostridia bacterium]
IKPDVVLYGEMLPEDVVEGAVSAIKNADMLIVGGTSLVVYPAASFVNYFRGDRLVLINLQPTPYDSRANLIFRNKLGEVFSEI